MVLNHVLVGVLLIPLAYLTIYAAPHAVSGASWAQVVVRTTALSIATLPIALFALMGTRYYFDAPLFVVGTHFPSVEIHHMKTAAVFDVAFA